jgi:acyl-CoA reductase-like NAD-dependent aldehyde dehydrogenase
MNTTTARPSIEVRSPWSGELIEALPPVDAVAIEDAITRAHAATATGLPPHRRAEILEGVADRVAAAREEFAVLMALEAGKPLRSGREEVDRAVNTAHLAAAEARRLTGELVPIDGTVQGAGRMAWTRRVPVGVVGAITPFNFPLNLVMHKLAPAVAADCPVVLKPAEKTPLTARRLAAIFRAAGLPIERLRVLVGDPVEIGAALCQDPRVRMITFTGSSRVGGMLQDAAPRKRVALELGNAAPAIVTADVDLDAVADKLARGAFANAGQACISVQRIYVARSIAEPLARAVAARADALRCGDPLDPNVDVGPLITAEARDRVLALVEDAGNCGAVQLSGGHREGNLISPIVLSGAERAARIETEEAFGPVVSINAFDSLDEAIDRANATEYGLQAAIFTNALDVAMRAAEHLDFAGVLVNESPAYRADAMPYGGFKASGNTKEGPLHAIREMTEEKLFVVNLAGAGTAAST